MAIRVEAMKLQSIVRHLKESGQYLGILDGEGITLRAEQQKEYFTQEEIAYLQAFTDLEFADEKAKVGDFKSPDSERNPIFIFNSAVTVAKQAARDMRAILTDAKKSKNPELVAEQLFTLITRLESVDKAFRDIKILQDKKLEETESTQIDAAQLRETASTKAALAKSRASYWNRFKAELNRNDALRWTLYILAGIAVATLTVMTVGMATGVGAAFAFASMCGTSSIAPGIAFASAAVTVSPTTVALGVVTTSMIGVALSFVTALVGSAVQGVVSRFQDWRRERKERAAAEQAMSQDLQALPSEAAVAKLGLGSPHVHMRRAVGPRAAATQDMKSDPVQPLDAKNTDNTTTGCGAVFFSMFKTISQRLSSSASNKPSDDLSAAAPSQPGRKR